MSQKLIRQSILNETRWYGVDIGSSVVSYCESCSCQRIHTCVDKSWAGDEWLFVFYVISAGSIMLVIKGEG